MQPKTPFTFFGGITYNQYLAALQAHSSGDAVDTSALASLPAGPNNPVNGNTNIDVTTANLRALGFNANPPGPDSTISLNTSITNYSGKPFNSGDYDLLGVVEHEFDEALRISSVTRLLASEATPPVPRQLPISQSMMVLPI